MNRFRIVQATLTAELAKPYAYGNPDKSDCFMMGCALVDALEGTETTKKYAGAYKTLPGAQKALRKRGFTTLVDFWAAELDRPAIAPAEAQFGDLAILRLADGAEHVAVCAGLRFITKTASGREDYSLGDVVAAFHLG
jgi:hypothetical protein